MASILVVFTICNELKDILSKGIWHVCGYPGMIGSEPGILGGQQD